ncbi:hypothetical protein RO3G_05792 [Rhizopus delemar RA 99-880]|uniref:Mitochondrial import inner membrane translocase subunit TIM22 n=1 Tax=Rhizopus delemar (strain RA 99-880 / ATCC MYA-4621 / FGSC 9543 / NRRL 43880) TaxID=246409 RepID=I1BY07_RHIO9|nr:hypothetical protein RO3G_05792 [Rhizopus delemar RA 99-880]|eukprot:EIE81087.1 hypothetical protein RO3G_05792 [Rhizopus delemar RA 99-880]
MSIPFNGQNSQMSPQEQETIKMMHAAMESCVVKTAMSGAAGFVMGGAFGLFMSSFEYAGPMMNEDLDQSVVLNLVAAGAFTGGLLAAKAGPQAMALGAGGFAAFSAGIDWYMHRD